MFFASKCWCTAGALLSGNRWQNWVTAIRWPAVFRLAVEATVLCLLGACLVESWLVKGLFVFCRVAGGSMGERLPGEHCRMVCEDCGQSFLCGLSPLPLHTRVICPNCGYADNEIASAKKALGQRIFIDRTSLMFRPPRRWEIIVLRNPVQADKIAVKRVVALPGETVNIAHGDIYINGRIARKSLEEQRAIALLVYDANHPSRTSGSRWKSERLPSRWRSEAGHFVYSPASLDEPPDWLLYHHSAGRSDHQAAAPITDLTAYNQAAPRREEDVHVVTDLLLSFRCKFSDKRGTLFVRADDGESLFEARLRLDKGVGELWRTDKLVGAATTTELTRQAGLQLVEVSLFDRQYLLAVNGNVVFAVPRLTSSRDVHHPTTPFAIGAQGSEVELEDLKIFRDVYYYNLLPNNNGKESVRLGPREYFLLGDNCPISEDSRSWPNKGAVSARLFLGRLLNLW